MTRHKPLIGISCSRRTSTHSRKENFSLGDYAAAITSAGGMPILIPNEFPLQDVPDLISRLDGLLLAGGGDIFPSLYGMKDDGKSGNRSKARDTLEKGLVELAIETDLPLLGICRGHQMLNAALGGTLFTDIPSQYPSAIVHDQPASNDPAALVHEVEIIADSQLAVNLDVTRLQVNSRHHQAIRALSPELKVTARASDGLIEGIEHRGMRFCLGVQWHPESLLKFEKHKAIFAAFIDAAKG